MYVDDSDGDTMKTVILYSSKAGATRQCAELLETRIEDSRCCDIKDTRNPRIIIQDAELVIMGSGVHAGRMYKPFRRFVKDNLDFLLMKRVAVFSSNALPETIDEIVSKNIPATLAAHAICIESFGGKRPFMKSADMDWLNLGNFERFVNAVTSEIASENPL